MTRNSHFDHLDDSGLVTLAQRGNDAAFAELIARNRTACMKLAVSILRNQEDAEDEVQNAIWKAYRNIGRFQQEAKFSTWLTRIVVNQCLMQIRKKKRTRLLHIDDIRIGEETGTLELRDERRDPEEVLAQAQVSEAIKTEIRRSPPLLRNVFVLRDVEQLPMKEVAVELGITVAAAKSRLLRARKELRDRMAKHTGQLGPATLLARA